MDTIYHAWIWTSLNMPWGVVAWAAATGVVFGSVMFRCAYARGKMDGFAASASEYSRGYENGWRDHDKLMNTSHVPVRGRDYRPSAKYVPSKPGSDFRLTE